MKKFNVKKINAIFAARQAIHPVGKYLLTLATISSALTFSQISLAQTETENAGEIESIFVWGRGTELLGDADSGSHGLVGNADFSTRPMMRVGELVEVVPGMIATQHSGPGKANQYFLRGMNLDHGSDFTGIFEGMPINFRSHAHASGYLDLNIMIPEIVEEVEFHKGTYYAQNGDFSAAGSTRFKTYDRLDQSFAEVTIGNFNHKRVVAAVSTDTDNGTILYAGEAEFRDGPWDLKQDVHKYNGFLKYSGSFMGIESQIIGMGYDSVWNATDQIPLREVENGNIGRFGFIDPTLGGESSRYSIIGNFQLTDNTKANAYYSKYKLNLFGNPTYFLNDRINGDQIEQEDHRSVMGGFVQHSQELTWGQRTVTPMVGVDFRYDDVGQVNLFNTRERQRLSTARNDSLEELSFSLYAESEILWTDRFRTTFGIRGEFFSWDVDAKYAANSGTGNDSIIMPKFNAAWIPFDGYEIYLNYGQGFHSNDVRGAEITVDPLDGVTPVDAVDVMVGAEGYEVGIRAEPTDGVNVTLVAFWMDLDSELLFVGDAGTSEPNDSTTRRGVELSAFWEMNDWIVFDATATYNRARFVDAPAGLDLIPDAHETTASAGITLVHPSGLTSSFRMRHFGDAPLEESGTVQKDATTLYNFGISYSTDKYEVGLDILNVFDHEGDDIEFWFESQLLNEAAPVDDFHFHPVESRAYRLSAKYKF